MSDSWAGTLDRSTAYIVSDLLRHVVDAGTGARIRREGWLDRPADVIAVEVCALPGARARDTCGRPRRDDRSAIRSARPTYIEYFVDGTAPVDYCHLHKPPSPKQTFARRVERRQETPRPPAPPLKEPEPPPIRVAARDE